MNEEFDPAAQAPLPETDPEIREEPVLNMAPPAEPVPAEAIPAPQAEAQPPQQPPVYQAPASQAEYQAPAQQPVYQAPASQAEAQTPQQQPVYQAPAQQPVYQAPPVNPYPQQPAQPAYPYGAAPAPQEAAPGKKSPYAPMGSFAMAVQLFLMGIPIIGLILSIVWACGLCRKIARRNLARAWLILLIVAILLTVAGAIVLRFCFPNELVRAFEQTFPGYTIKWN